MTEFGGLTEGVSSVPVQDDVLPVLVKGADRIRAGGQPVLCVFNAAVGNRAASVPPFFSGVGLSDETGLPLIAFSDPTLAHANDLSLAFYAGSKKAPDLPRFIAQYIDALAEKYDARPILVGASGGGFASLNIGRQCRCDPSILVWNPQTSISRYSLRLVERYLNVGFPGHGETIEGDRGAARAVLSRAGCDETVVPWQVPRRTVYLQNKSDWHLKHHCIPFLKSFEWTDAGRGALCSQSLKTAVLVGAWGEGHVTPPRAMILDAITLLVAGTDPASIVQQLSRRHGRDDWGLHSAVSNDSFQVSARRTSGKIHARIAGAGSETGPKGQFAFYLMHGKDVLEKRWYGPDPNCEFDDPGTSGLRVVGFVRDDLGEVVRKATAIA